MGTVSSLQPPVNPTQHTIARVIEWIEAQSKKADMGATSARLRITSINQMHEQVAEDEPRDDALWLLQNIDRVRERWARRNPSNATGTARDYASRAKNSIQQYLKWSASPDTYKFDPKRGVIASEGTSGKKAEKKGAPKKSGAPIVPVIPVGQAHEPPRATVDERRNFPLGEGRGAIVFSLPSTGIEFSDVRKFAVHLFTLAKDFNIQDADQARIFAMVVRGDGQ
jgi:hypothetical protein